MADVRLTVNGQQYGGWTEAAITRGIEAIAGSFRLSVSEEWGGLAEPWPIKVEDECAVSIDGATVIDGYVDDINIDFDKRSHSFEVAGRDKAAALVDCSALLGQWEFSKIGVFELCQKLAEPFGITVYMQPGIADAAIGTGPAPKKGRGAPSGAGTAGRTASSKLGAPNTKLTINPGDSPFEVIDRICRVVGVLPMSDGIGNIVLTRAGGLRAAGSLVQGVNILAGSAKRSGRNRYSRYVVTGQSAGDDDLFGSAAAAVTGEARDSNVRRADRVLLIRPEGVVTTAFAGRRAEWEATVRAARSLDALITVQDWRQSEGGEVWPINAIVSVDCPVLDLVGDMLITAATYSQTVRGGTTTTLALAAPNSFIPEPVIVKPPAGGADAFSSILGG